MEFTARQIATFLHGEVVGNQEVIINSVSKIEEGIPGTLTFLANPKYNSYLYETKASVVLINKSLVLEKEVEPTLIRVENAYDALAKLMEIYVQSIPVKTGIEMPSFINSSATVDSDTYVGAFAYLDEGVKIGKNVQIYPHCFVGKNVEIEDNTVLFSGVKVYPECKIGKNCILHSGVVIGSDGFGFAPEKDGTYKKLHQIGNVIIHNDVEIGANTTIDCATMGSTIIRSGVKIDNLVQIAHNVDVGENTVMAAFVGVSGSSKIGKNCIFGGQAGVAGHLKIGNNVTLGGKTGASNDIEDNKILMGEWGMDASKFRRVYAVFRNLPDLYKDLYQLRREVKNLKAE
ncbi:MAG: UDP-3-O-(3-hydroxymyristoyl)glucosamine N-acyltransferase [Prolixibacteraceae bacterium]|jgi:UDP-3-O-[3-hydroxymyristoyl] glucosamine N-acyltransferase|nr:UDP-3-O-(3-hydroxymyristoyl)glucosamine N-acyltransferase [Prolixibacteraceae bacterium]